MISPGLLRRHLNSGERRKFPRGPKFCHNRVTSQTSFAFANTAWFCFTFFFIFRVRGGHGIVAPPRYANALEYNFVSLIVMAQIKMRYGDDTRDS